MAPKRPAAADPESSSSEEDEQEEEEDVNLSSPSPKKPPSSKKPEKPPSSKPPRKPSGDDDDDDEDDGSGSDDSDDDDDDKSKKKPPPQSQSQSQSQPQPQLKPHQPPSKPDSGSSEDDDGSSSEEDDEEAPPAQRPSRGVDPSIKPISSRPMDASPKPKKPPSSEPPSKKPKSSSSSDAAPPSEQKRQLFQRLWGPDDEIAVLRGLAEYRSKKGSLPSSSQDVDALRGHIRGALQLEVTNQQLSDKIRRLKKKFATNSARGRSGADPKFTKDHERSAFEISKKIWGAAGKSSPSANAAVDADTDDEKSEESDDEAAGSDQNAKEENNNNNNNNNSSRTRFAAVAAVANGKAEHERGKLPLPYLKEAVDELAKEHPCGAAFKRAFEFLDEPKAKGMEEKLKKLRMEEIKQHLRRMDLMKETVKMMLEALAKSD